MTTTRVRLCALPAESWSRTLQWGNETIAFASFVDDLVTTERRVAKEINVENEQARYNLCCTGVESGVPRSLLFSITDVNQVWDTLQQQRIPSLLLTESYLEGISLAYERVPARATQLRLGATFITPHQLPKIVDELGGFITDLQLGVDSALTQRLKFLQAAAAAGCGVIELQESFASGVVSEIPLTRHELPSTPLPPSDPGGTVDELDEVQTEEKRRELSAILREAAQRAVANAKAGEPAALNCSNQPHNVITEVLREFAYSEDGKKASPVYVQIIYTDGSAGRPFPLRCLPVREPRDIDDLHRTQSQPLAVGLLSMRHLQMDRDVDMEWLLNQEVSKSRALGETDEFCYRQSVQQLADPSFTCGAVMHLYQTGLQPAVVGFYRALVEELLHRADRPASIEVVPQYSRPAGEDIARVLLGISRMAGGGRFDG